MPVYTLEDVGCYVDGARGIYATDAIVERAEGHGFTVEPCSTTDGHEHLDSYFPSLFAGCEHSAEIEDGATEYMNAQFPVKGAYWGRSEAGDWGLWPEEDES